MQRYVALLRGINVGGNNKVEMKKLKKVFEDLRYTDVLTYINSGNIIFSTQEKNITKLTDTIEKAILKHFGFSVKILLRTAKNIKTLSQKIPQEWVNDAKQKTDVLFLWEAFDSKETLKLIKSTIGVDMLIYVQGAIIWNVERKNYTKSGMKKFIGTEIYKNMTARNVNTVRKLGEFMG